MTALLVYAAVLLLGVAVLVNRRGERQLEKVRREIRADEQVLRDADRRLAEARRRTASIDQGLQELEHRKAEAERALEAAERRLDEARRLPVDRYYVFDRLEPRPGRIWAVRIAQSETDPVSRESRRTAAAWGGVRTWLLIAGSRKEAVDRAGLRHSRGAGYEIEDAVTCALFAASEASGQGDAVRGGPAAAAPASGGARGATPRAPATLAAARAAGAGRAEGAGR